jgi:membrane-associated protease RseP (regulator of RpoE activity)
MIGMISITIRSRSLGTGLWDRAIAAGFVLIAVVAWECRAEEPAAAAPAALQPAEIAIGEPVNLPFTPPAASSPGTSVEPPAASAGSQRGAPRSGWLGMVVAESNVPGRWRIDEVVPGGPAGLAGVRAGDELRAVNGVAPRNADEVSEALTAIVADQTVQLAIARDGEVRDVPVRAAPRPAPAPDREDVASPAEVPAAAADVAAAIPAPPAEIMAPAVPLPPSVASAPAALAPVPAAPAMPAGAPAVPSEPPFASPASPPAVPNAVGTAAAGASPALPAEMPRGSSRFAGGAAPTSVPPADPAATASLPSIAQEPPASRFTPAPSVAAPARSFGPAAVPPSAAPSIQSSSPASSFVGADRSPERPAARAQAMPGRRAALGVRTIPIDRATQARFQLDAPAGAYVTGVVENLPASRAGVPPGSVIVALDERPVQSPADLTALVTSGPVDRPVTVRFVLPGGQARSAEVLLQPIDPPLLRALEAEPAVSPTARVARRPVEDGIETLREEIRTIRGRLEQLDRRLEDLLSRQRGR